MSWDWDDVVTREDAVAIVCDVVLSVVVPCVDTAAVVYNIVVPDLAVKIADVSDTVADVGSTVVDVSGTVADVSGTVADVSGTVVDENPACGVVAPAVVGNSSRCRR
jgi:hypothetical protein